MSTTANPNVDEQLTTTTSIVTSVILGILMFGLGCSILPQSLFEYIKKPKTFITGLLLQLFLMPFLGLALSQMVVMSTEEALGVIIQAVCPGGLYSNVLSYWLDGDMHLSIVMTTCSTILAIGTMPLWLFVLPKIINLDENIQIPFDQLGYALLGSIGPIFLGMIVKWKIPDYSEKITRVCTIFASVGILITSIVIGVLQDRAVVVTWKQALIAILFPVSSLFISYGATRLPCFDFSSCERRTVAIETAMQNSAIATTIVILSVESSDSFITVIMFPALYGGAQLFGGVIAVIIYQVLKKSGYTCLLPSEFDGDISNKVDTEISSINHFDNETTLPGEVERSSLGRRANRSSAESERSKVIDSNTQGSKTNFGYVESET